MSARITIFKVHGGYVVDTYSQDMFTDIEDVLEYCRAALSIGDGEGEDD
jgi:hypothetical protein